MNFASNRFKILIIFLFIIIIFSIRAFSESGLKDRKDEAGAIGNSVAITSQDNWNAGSLSNVDSASNTGSITLDDKNTYPSDKYDLSGSTITANVHEDNAAQAFDSDPTSYWGPISIACGDLDSQYMIIDAGVPLAVASVTALGYLAESNGSTIESLGVNYSDDGNSWTSLVAGGISGPTPQTIVPPETITKRYWKLYWGNGICNLEVITQSLLNFELYPPESASATHTTGATQIDGGDDFWSWDGFTPADSEPANTSITYRYRSSADGATWNAWHSAIGDVEDRSEDNLTKYRYLQVEATLANTDGVSTPTIDSYDIDYHTEVKPDTPSASTAVVQ